jgi:hypothetical protein
MLSVIAEAVRRNRQTDMLITTNLSSFIQQQKQKVNLSLCLTKHHATKTYQESGGIAPRDASSQFHCPVILLPEKELSVPFGLKAGGEEKKRYPFRDSNPGRTARQPLTESQYWLSYPV